MRWKGFASIILFINDINDIYKISSETRNGSVVFDFTAKGGFFLSEYIHSKSFWLIYISKYRLKLWRDDDTINLEDVASRFCSSVLSCKWLMINYIFFKKFYLSNKGYYWDV